MGQKEYEMSNVRIVARWHMGNDIITREAQGEDTLTTLRIALPESREDAIREIATRLQRPNDVHRPRCVTWSWYTIVQVWASNKTDAATLIYEAHTHGWDKWVPTSEIGVSAKRCTYGCPCGAFPIDAQYVQDLAIDRVS